ncbi:hypothetical protein NRB20_72900 [Nocardia sp. RB20]|uniref:Uncharacterized protein n=2 Tax=Nocardia macrotermitis TaxID=2585198 RepID=A0A7K0DEL6_9NOCA|nr:hypothetical protein [Nocardia macrotermitis]
MYHISRATAMAAMIFAATVISAGVANADAVNPVQPAAEPNPAAPADNSPQAAPVDPGAEYLKAFDGIAGTFSNDSTLGRVVGTTAGVLVGCPVGAVTGGTLFIPIAPLTPVGIVGGCLIGAAALGFVGGTVGSIISGSPATMNALTQQYQSLHSKGLIAAPVPVQNSAP